MEVHEQISAAQRSQLAVSTASAHTVRDLPLPKTPNGAIVAPQPPGIRGMSVDPGQRCARGIAHCSQTCTEALGCARWML